MAEPAMMKAMEMARGLGGEGKGGEGRVGEGG